MYKKGEVKALTFSCEHRQGGWVGEGHLLEKFLKGVRFVAAAACGPGEQAIGEKLILFYVKPKKEGEPNIRYLGEEDED